MRLSLVIFVTTPNEPGKMAQTFEDYNSISIFPPDSCHVTNKP